MKILVLAKRYTSGKDSVKDNFGRVIRLFEKVATKHEVTVLEADHITKEKFDTKIGKMKVKVMPFSPMKVLSYYKQAKKEAEEGSYDMIYATSYPLFGGLGLLIAKRLRIKFGYDVQDNYYSYTSNPLLLFMSDQAVKRANLVSCASEKLAIQAKALNSQVVVIANGYDPKIAKPADRIKSRRALGLPLKARIVSYTGSLEFRGPDMLLKSFGKLQKKDGSIVLLFVGSSIKRKYGKTRNHKIIFLDSMPYAKLFTAINAADVMVMPYPKNSFTEVMMAPYKLVEYMVCRKPIVISDVGEMDKLAPQFVFKNGEADDMLAKIEEALKCKSINYSKKLKELTWKVLGDKLTEAITNI